MQHSFTPSRISPIPNKQRESGATLQSEGLAELSDPTEQQNLSEYSKNAIVKTHCGEQEAQPLLTLYT